ncbi:MAG TPA: hypothetical protein VHY37_01180 [Tepidisphaeraceae bacterium]|jgi:transcriptional regulator with XRE-family HTH domain|nr:hypothetical protein [Tepidisphaeraceae bacterium]
MTTLAKRSPRRPASRKRSRSGSTGEIRSLRDRYRLSQLLLARLLDVSLRTVSAAESASPAPAKLRRNLAQVRRLCEALVEAMNADYVGHWLNQPNEMLAGLKPVEAIERGHIDLVWQVVEGLRSGSQL